MESGNVEIGRDIQAAHTCWALSVGKKPRAIRLPAPTHLNFVRISEKVTVTMSGAAVGANMQTNAAGFEGWCLALKLWLPDIRTIGLVWDKPAEMSTGPAQRHYARFLFRVQRFQELFPDWFLMGTPEHLDECEVRAGGAMLLNIAGSQMPDRPRKSPEALLEWALTSKHKTAMLETFKLTELDRQFPVGLFRSLEVRKANAVFTGGTSAIDMVGTDGDTLTIFELKASSNIMVGALDELLFYTSVVRAAMGERPRFGFSESTVPSRAVIGRHEVTSAKRLKAILLVEQIHPLLEHPLLFSTLNNAASRFAGATGVPVTYEAWRVCGWPAGTPVLTPFA